MQSGCCDDPSTDRRKNGFERPHTLKQYVSVAIVIADGLIFALVVLPLLEGVEMWCFGVALYLPWSVLVVSWVAVESTDPKDPHVGLESTAPKDPNVGLPSANASTGPWCFICLVHVRDDSKHCWDCGKCVYNFDHHCPWLNTCVGASTYRSFLAAVWALLGMLSVLLASCALLAVRYLTNSGDGDRFSMLMLVAIFVIATLHVPLWGLDLFLAGFHLLLCWRGQTTYQYLTGKTPRPARRVVEEPCEVVDVMVGDTNDDKSDLPASIPSPSSPRRVTSGISKFSKSSKASQTSVKREVSNFIFGSSVLPADPWDLQEERRKAAKSVQAAAGQQWVAHRHEGAPQVVGASAAENTQPCVQRATGCACDEPLQGASHVRL